MVGASAPASRKGTNFMAKKKSRQSKVKEETVVEVEKEDDLTDTEKMNVEVKVSTVKKNKRYLCARNFSHDAFRFKIGDECQSDIEFIQ